jgi:capsular polysaccharide biosynthesis protein
MPADKLAGSVSTASVSTGAGPVTTRGTVLIEVTVAIDNKVEAAAAANALGNYVVQQTEGQYVRDSLRTYAQTDATYVTELHALALQINSLSHEIAVEQNLPLIDKLVLDSAYADAVQRQGNYEQQLSENEESADLANEIYVAQIISRAASSKVSSRSRKDSVVFGGVIGLLIGLIVALYLGLRRPARPVRTA